MCGIWSVNMGMSARSTHIVYHTYCFLNANTFDETCIIIIIAFCMQAQKVHTMHIDILTGALISHTTTAYTPDIYYINTHTNTHKHMSI